MHEYMLYVEHQYKAITDLKLYTVCSNKIIKWTLAVIENKSNIK